MSMLNYKEYNGYFEYDAKADIFHGQVLHLRDIITFQGRSIDELKTALADSVEDYLEFCAQENKEPEKPYSGRFNVRLAPQLHRDIVIAATERGVSLNQWVAKTLAEALDNESY